MSASQSTLIVKNIPKFISDITSILPSAAKEVKPFGRRRVLLTYENEQAAQTVFEQLQQLEVKPGKLLNVTFFRKNVKPVANTNIGKTTTSSKATQTKLHPSNETALPQISKYVSQLFACDAKLNFVQPPPPYLKYAYPRITPDILDAISIALMSNTYFYTQVLHLMNRMNLEPPFGAKSAGMCLNKLWPRDVSTQTMEEAVAVSEISEVIHKATKVIDEKSETELESSEDDDAKSSNQHQSTSIQMQLKRKAPEELEAQFKKKARQLLQTTLRKQKHVESIDSASKNVPQNVFEQSESVGKKSKIAVKIQHQQSTRSLKSFVLPSDLSATRLSPEQLQALPIYKNYQIGAPSNKLYIKNLDKDVSEEDLKQLYARFVAPDNMEIKVMQQGRMKGQAFVTFHGLSEVDAAVMMAKALAETNGFVLRQKPMVVCYGKKQLGLVETIYEENGADKNNASSYLTKRNKPQLSTQHYKYLICIDFEATCWADQAPPQWRESEVIEFPAILVNAQTGKIEAEFHKYVMPIESPKLSAYCTELTGIKQHMVDDGMPLQTAIMMFQEWLRKELRARNLQLPKMSKDKMTGNCAFVTWTDWDCGICLAKECQRKRLKKPSYFNQWIDLRAVFRAWYKYKPLNFADAITHVGLTFEGRPHSGQDDARNLAALAHKMTCDGAPLAITKDLAPFQLNSNCML